MFLLKNPALLMVSPAMFIVVEGVVYHLFLVGSMKSGASSRGTVSANEAVKS